MHVADPTITWQGFILLNLAGLIIMAFWAGRQAERIDGLQREVKQIEEESQAIPVATISAKLDVMAKQLKQLEEESQAIPVATISAKLDAMAKQLDRLTEQVGG